MKLSPDTHSFNQPPHWEHNSEQEPEDIPLAEEYKTLAETFNPDFILFEYERKLARAHDLVDYYQKRITEIDKAQETTNPSDLSTIEFLTKKKENYSLQLLRVGTILGLQAELESSQNLPENQLRIQKIAEFKFPTDVSGKTENLQTQLIVKQSNLKNQKRIFEKISAPNAQQISSAEYLETLATIKELETEIVDLEQELQRRKNTTTNDVAEEDLPIAEEVEETAEPIYLRPRPAKPLPETQDAVVDQKPRKGGLTRFFKKLTDKFKRAA